MIIKQYLNSLYKYSKKIERTQGGNFYIDAIKGAFTMHPVFCCGNASSSKLSQIEKTIFRSKLNYASSETFFYELDENRIMIPSNRVIDNMPVDYSLIIDSSISALRENSSSYNNSVSAQNLAYFALLEKYIDSLASKISNKKAAAAITSLKSRPAANLYEALQRILFYHQIIAQTGHTLNGLGRLDKLLSRFNPDENTENLIKDFLITLHKFYNFNSNDFLGDTGQLIILGGIEEDGSYFSNAYTLLFIKALQQLRLPDPKILLRSSKNMPSELISSAVECIATGIGSPLISNDDAVMPSLLDLGYSMHDACNYGVSACWEPLSIGNSLEQNNIDCIEFGQVLNSTICDPTFTSCTFPDSVFALFTQHLKEHIDAKIEKLNSIRFELDPVLTVITEGCLESGKDISCGGAVYNNYGILSVGLSSAVNSLVNINNYVFKDKLFSLADVSSAVKQNYSGYEAMQTLFLQKKDGFGSDSSYALSLTKEIMSITSSQLSAYKNPLGGKLKFGLSSPTYIRSGASCGATADGRRAGEPFAAHISSSGDNVLTQLVRFASSLDYTGYTANGNVVDIMLSPSLINGENRPKFCSYLLSCIEMGVYQLQFNVVSLSELLDAKAHPELHKDLIVRVWGFSAYFNDLPDEYKDTLIRRAQEMECA